MTPQGYIEKGTEPRVGDIVSSPHEFIFKRGYPFTYKVLKRRKNNGRLLLTCKVTAPSKKVVSESREIYFDEID